VQCLTATQGPAAPRGVVQQVQVQQVQQVQQVR
jgi:hypothetical protein